MSIIIYSDIQKVYTGYFDILLQRIEDYVDVYKSILDAIYQNQQLTVVVQNKLCVSYFKKMQTHYDEYIQIKVYSSRAYIQNKVSISIPDYITEDDIVKDKLNEKKYDILFNPKMNFEDNILNYYLGSYFTNVRFPFTQIVDFLKELDLSSLDALDSNIILNKVFKKRINLWKKNCKNNYEINILDAFLSNHTILLNKIAQYIILKNYPQNLLEDIIGPILEDFESLNIKGDPFISENMDTNDIQRNISIILNNKNIYGLNYDDIIYEIECLSGLFNEELQYVYELLKNNTQVLDLSILEKIREKFKYGSELDIMFEGKLSKIIPPSKVVKPVNMDSLDKWISWALTSYLPYKFWMESNDICNEEIDKYSLMYGDWIFNHYDSLISSDYRMLYKAIANLSSYIKQDEISLIVMIDNFNYKYVPLCTNYFISKGFSTTMDQPMISMIPTETSVSKTAFFSGQPFNTKEITYDSMSKEWENFLGGNVEYLSDIGKLDSINILESKLYILNYLSIDITLHDNQNNYAIPVSRKIQEELKAMINKIVNFAKRLSIENKIKIYFISDHGSTKISNEQQNLIDPKYYKSKTEDCAYRFIALKDKQFDIYKDSIGHMCYVMDRNNFGIKENYLIAKGYNRFMETNQKFYVHGSITPEENIVPLLKFERINVKLIEPEILLRNNEFRYSTISSVKITIKNYNEYSLENIEISIVNSNIRWEPGNCTLSKINRESQIDVTMDKVRILKSSTDESLLGIKIKYYFLGKRHEKIKEFSINIKSIQENNFNFDDLL